MTIMRFLIPLAIATACKLPENVHGILRNTVSTPEREDRHILIPPGNNSQARDHDIHRQKSRSGSTFYHAIMMAVDTVRAHIQTSFSPMESLGYINVTARDPFTQYQGGPAGRLGLDVKPRPFQNETEPVSSYEFKSIPLDTRPPMKISEIDDKIPPAYNIVFGVLLGCFCFIPLGLIYVGVNTENSTRNVVTATMCMGSLTLVLLILGKVGLFHSLWETHIGTWGQHWFTAFFLFPVLLSVVAIVMDTIIRGNDAWLLCSIRRFFGKIAFHPFGSKGNRADDQLSQRDHYYHSNAHNYGVSAQHNSGRARRQDWFTQLFL